jgi:hypothetical protein
LDAEGGHSNRRWWGGGGGLGREQVRCEEHGHLNSTLKWPTVSIMTRARHDARSYGATMWTGRAKGMRVSCSVKPNLSVAALYRMAARSMFAPGLMYVMLTRVSSRHNLTLVDALRPAPTRPLCTCIQTAHQQPAPAPCCKFITTSSQVCDLHACMSRMSQPPLHVPCKCRSRVSFPSHARGGPGGQRPPGHCAHAFRQGAITLLCSVQTSHSSTCHSMLIPMGARKPRGEAICITLARKIEASFRSRVRALSFSFTRPHAHASVLDDLRGQNRQTPLCRDTKCGSELITWGSLD